MFIELDTKMIAVALETCIPHQSGCTSGACFALVFSPVVFVFFQETLSSAVSYRARQLGPL